MINNYQGFIFDLDGTLVNSKQAVETVLLHWCKLHQLDFDTVVVASHGTRIKDFIPKVAPDMSVTLAITELAELPAPKVKLGQVLIQSTRSLVSLGTERMLVEFGKASLIQKARQQPDKVKLVLDKIKTEGLIPTIETVFNKLEQPLPLGYCNVGKVIEVGNIL